MDNNQNEEPTIGSNVNQQPVINPPVGQPQLNDSSNSLVASQAPPAPFEQVQPEQALTIEPQINNDSSNNIIQTTTVNSAEKPKKNKKLTIIIIAVVLILLFAVGVIIYLLASGKSPSEDISVDTYSAETLSKTFDPEAPIPIKKNGKMGYISTSGAVIIEPKFNNLSSFMGDYAIADSKSVIDKKGEVKLTSKKGKINNLENGYWLIDQRIYDTKLKQVTPDTMLVDSISNSGEYKYMKYNDATAHTEGVVDMYGKAAYTYKKNDTSDKLYIQYKAPNSLAKDDYALIAYGNEDVSKTAIINLKNGKEVINIDFPKDEKRQKFIEAYDSSYNGDDSNIFVVSAKVKNGEKSYGYDIEYEYSMYISDDKVAYQADAPAQIASVYNIKDKILKIKYTDGKKNTWYDIKSKEMLSEEPELYKIPSLSEFELITGYTEYKSNSATGIMKGDNIVLKSEYSYISYLPLDTYKYIEQKTGKQFIITNKKDDISQIFSLYDLKGKKSALDFKAKIGTSVYVSSSSIFMAYPSEDSKSLNVYNLLTGKSFTKDVEEDKSDINCKSNYFAFSQGYGKKIQIYNFDMKKIYEQEES